MRDTRDMQKAAFMAKRQKALAAMLLGFAVALGVSWHFYAKDFLGQAEPRVIALTGEDFTMRTGAGVALVDFWAAWCGPCKSQEPIIEKLAESYAGRIHVGKVNVDANMELAERFDIHTIPTIIILKNGVEVRRFVGLQSEKDLTDALQEHLAGN